MKRKLSTVRTTAATTVSIGCQRKAAGTTSPTEQTSSRMPSQSQAPRGRASNDGTSLLILSNMKTFMTPDPAYRIAVRACRTHRRISIYRLRATHFGYGDLRSCCQSMKNSSLLRRIRSAYEPKSKREVESTREADNVVANLAMRPRVSDCCSSRCHDAQSDSVVSFDINDSHGKSSGGQESG